MISYGFSQINSGETLEISIMFTVRNTAKVQPYVFCEKLGTYSANILQVFFYSSYCFSKNLNPEKCSINYDWNSSFSKSSPFR